MRPSQTRQDSVDKRCCTGCLRQTLPDEPGESVREDKTKNGACAWARLQERFGRDSGVTSFHRGVPVRLAEGEAVRRRVARVGQEGLKASTRVT